MKNGKRTPTKGCSLECYFCQRYFSKTTKSSWDFMLCDTCLETTQTMPGLQTVLAVYRANTQRIEGLEKTVNQLYTERDKLANELRDLKAEAKQETEDMKNLAAIKEGLKALGKLMTSDKDGCMPFGPYLGRFPFWMMRP